MQQPTKTNMFLKTVCDQIRWKKAHDVILREIENHITDQKNAFVASGLDEETALDMAIKEMGDPVLIGTELDRTHKPKVEWSIISLAGILLLIGLAVRLLVTNDGDMPWILTNSIIAAVLGTGCMAIGYFLDFTFIGKYPKSIFWGLVVVTIGVMTISQIHNGQQFYLPFILLLFPVAFSGVIYDMRTKGTLGIILCGLFFFVPVMVAFMTPNFTSVALFSIISFILLLFAIYKGWFNVRRLWATLLVCIPTIIIPVMMIAIGVYNSPYRVTRLLSTINPFLDPKGEGYTLIVIRNMIANAKFIGQGELGSGPSTLPCFDTDNLLTYLIHRFGWISFIVILTAIMVFVIRSYVLCARQKSVLGRLVSTSVLLTFSIQAIVYIISNLGYQLIYPLTLPLVSYSGTATIINMILIGIMLSVFKSGDIVDDSNISKLRKTVT